MALPGKANRTQSGTYSGSGGKTGPVSNINKKNTVVKA